MTTTQPSPSRIRLRARTSASAMGAAHLHSQNLVAALNALSRQGLSSRARIAAETGLTRGTVSILVQELIDWGIVEELGTVRSGGIGRPITSLVTRTDLHWGIGIEINVDYLAVCAVDLLGNVRHREVSPTGEHGRTPDVMLGEAVALLRRTLGVVRDQGARPIGIVAALPGIVGIDSDTVRLAPNLGWRDVPVAQPLGEAVGVPVRIENSANLAALGEAWFGIGTDDTFFRVAADDHGIGGGLVLDGELYRGVRGTAAEVGHVVVDPGGPRCTCGARGCLEQFASLRAILRAVGIEPASERRADYAAAGNALVQRLESGDGPALDAVARAARTLAVAVASVVHIVDPQSIILGSWLAVLAPWLAPELDRALAGEARATGTDAVAVRVSELSSDGAMLGAAGLVVHDVFEAPEILSVTA